MEDFGFQVEVKRTDRRKSASISLDGNLVRVTVPKSLSDRRIRDLIGKRTPWIKSKLKEQSLRPSSKPKEYVSGETVPYLGKNYRLKVVEGEIPSIKMVGGYLFATILNSEKNRQDAVKNLLKVQVLKDMIKIVRYIMEIKYSNFTLKVIFSLFCKNNYLLVLYFQ